MENSRNPCLVPSPPYAVLCLSPCAVPSPLCVPFQGSPSGGAVKNLRFLTEKGYRGSLFPVQMRKNGIPSDLLCSKPLPSQGGLERRRHRKRIFYGGGEERYRLFRQTKTAPDRECPGQIVRIFLSELHADHFLRMRFLAILMGPSCIWLIHARLLPQPMATQDSGSSAMEQRIPVRSAMSWAIPQI